MSFRTARLVAFALPALLVVVVVTSGGWRLHGGNVERVGHVSATAASATAPTSQTGNAATTQLTFVHHLSPSIPWPACLGLVVLCVLPAVGSLLAWSGSRRGAQAAYSFSGGPS